VGGLVEMSYAGTNCFVAYDGNGNVAALVNAGDGTVVANYEYGPFGEVIRATGLTAKSNPFRFSSKYQDDESDLLMYIHRPYSASQGRFLCKDPINEPGFQSLTRRRQTFGRNEEKNLYCFVRNTPTTRIDRLGLSVNDPPDLNLNVCCCDAKTRADSLRTLTQRWRDAAQFLDSNGVGLDPDGVTGVSCIDSANRILSFMSPVPKCWLCYIERRGTWGAPFGGGDENYIRCDDVTQSGGNSLSFAFDWWYEKDMGYKAYSPIPMWRYGLIFPYGPWDQAGAWWTKASPAPDDDCINKSGWKNGPENYKMFLQPLVDQYGHKGRSN
jgi:RHS repeat-associated protein